MNQAKQSFYQFWAARSGQERKMLTAAAFVIVLAAIYVLLIEPAREGRKQLTRNLPELRQQVAQIQALSKEAAVLSSKPAFTTPTLTRDNIEAALARKGLKPQKLTLSGDQVQIKLASASFVETLGWLEEMQSTTMLTVIDADIIALPEAGKVDATLSLRQQRNE